jgi:hypothetical protein
MNYMTDDEWRTGFSLLIHAMTKHMSCLYIPLFTDLQA